MLISFQRTTVLISRFRLGVIGVGALLAGAAPQSAAGLAQTQVTSRAAQIQLGGRLHSQFVTSSAAEGNASDFLVRRARLMVTISVSDLVDARVQPDFQVGSARLADAFVRFNVDPRFRLSMGRFKRAFDVFELDSSTDIVVVERTGKVPGASGCAGVGGLCSLSRFTQGLGYAGRDSGVRVEGSLGRLSYVAAVTNGGASGRGDENSAKSVSGRASFRAGRGIRLAVNASSHDRSLLEEDGGVRRFGAVGADLEIGDFRRGTHFQLGVVAGDNWRMQTSGADHEFLALQAIVSHYVHLKGARFAAAEPIFRIGWADPTRTTEGDAGLLVTPGVFLYVWGKNRIGANLDFYDPRTGESEYSFKLQAYVYF